MKNQKRYTICHTWSSWIPTNLGTLRVEFIGDNPLIDTAFKDTKYEKNYDSDSFLNDIIINNINISDTSCLLTRTLNLFRQSEYEASGHITFKKFIKNESIDFIFGTVEIFFEEKVSIKSNYKLYLSGAFFLSDITILTDPNDPSIKDIDFSTHEEDIVANALYNLIKRVVHGDNHHHAKIDTLISIHRLQTNKKLDSVSEHDIEKVKILNHISKSLKTMEKEIKTLPSKGCRDISLKTNSYNGMKGLLSYTKTFLNTFCTQTMQDKEDLTPYAKKILKNMENILESAEITTEHLSKILNDKKSTGTTLLTLLSIFIAMSILINAYIPFKPLDASEMLLQYKIRLILDTAMYLGMLYIFILRPMLCWTSGAKVQKSCTLEAKRIIFNDGYIAFFFISLLLVLTIFVGGYLWPFLRNFTTDYIYDTLKVIVMQDDNNAKPTVNNENNVTTH